MGLRNLKIQERWIPGDKQKQKLKRTRKAHTFPDALSTKFQLTHFSALDSKQIKMDIATVITNPSPRKQYRSDFYGKKKDGQKQTF